MVTKLWIAGVAVTMIIAGWFGTQKVLASTCTVATPGTVNSVIASATGGSTVCLADGSYSGISISNNTSRSDYVTVEPQSTSKLNIGDLNLNNVSYVHLQNITFTGGTIRGHHLHITDSAGAQHIVNGVSQIFHIYGSVNNADILIDHITYNNIPNPCNDNTCVEGRISVMDGGSPSGITISNSLFSGGSSDGIQVLGDPVGVQIIGNEFTGIVASGGTHTDSIQTYYDGSGTVIKNNYFHDTDDALMMPDGGTDEQIIGNVFDLDDFPYDVEVYGWTGGRIEHNTFVYGTSCFWDKCGTLWIRNSTGLIVKNNVIGELKLESGTIIEDHNLIYTGAANPGTGTKTGNTCGQGHDAPCLPQFVSSTPIQYTDYAQTNASPGHGQASDGTDMGMVLATNGWDVNGDNVVNGADISLLIADFNKMATSATTPTADINSDGVINGSDLSSVINHFGQ